MYGLPTKPDPAELRAEIERIGRNVFICKLFRMHQNHRGKVFQRIVVNGRYTEARRVAAAMLELAKIKEAG